MVLSRKVTQLDHVCSLRHESFISLLLQRPFKILDALRTILDDNAPPASLTEIIKSMSTTELIGDNIVEDVWMRELVTRLCDPAETMRKPGKLIEEATRG